MEGGKWTLSTGVDSGILTCIEGSATRHGCGLGRVGRCLHSEMLLDKCTQYQER